jgi:predicted molibdopterin-dependent oxidoreductase YjgC
MGRGFTLDDLFREIDAGAVRGVWVSGGYTTDWIDEATAARFEPVDLLVVQDLFDSPLWRRADYQLPGAAFAERDGSYVNQADRLQSATWAIRPPAGVQVEGRLFWRLLEMSGMYDARAVLDEVAREIGYFTAAAGEISPLGVDLKINELAQA